MRPEIDFDREQVICLFGFDGCALHVATSLAA